MPRAASILFSLFFFCASAPVLAQDNGSLNKVHLDLGVKLGANLSMLDGQGWEGGYKTNILGGAWVSIHGNRLGVQVDGLFSQTSYTTGPTFNSIYSQYLNAGKDSLKNGRFRLNYFNIPVLFQLRILSKAWLQVGPQYSGLVSVEDRDEFVKDAKGLFSTGTLSGVAGLQIQVTRHLNAGARYIFGVSDFNKTDVSESWKQYDVQIHVGYKI